MLIMSCYTGFFNVRKGWQSLNTGPRFYWWRKLEYCIVESGVKHHNHNPNPQVSIYEVTDTKKQKDKQSESNTIGNELI